LLIYVYCLGLFFTPKYNIQKQKIIVESVEYVKISLYEPEYIILSVKFLLYIILHFFIYQIIR